MLSLASRASPEAPCHKFHHSSGATQAPSLPYPPTGRWVALWFLLPGLRRQAGGGAATEPGLAGRSGAASGAGSFLSASFSHFLTAGPPDPFPTPPASYTSFACFPLSLAFLGFPTLQAKVGPEARGAWRGAGAAGVAWLPLFAAHPGLSPSRDLRTIQSSLIHHPEQPAGGSSQA